MGLICTWHDDLREAHFAGDGSGAVHQVGEILPDLMDITRQQLQSDPKP